MEYKLREIRVLSSEFIDIDIEASGLAGSRENGADSLLDFLGVEVVLGCFLQLETLGVDAELVRGQGLRGSVYLHSRG